MPMIRPNTPAATPNLFPLQVSGRKLQTASGNDFFVVAEAGWGGMARLSLSAADTYIADRKAKGFNAILMMLIAKHHSINSGSSTNANGDNPFSGTALIPANVVENYFVQCDAIIAKLLAANMVCLLAPCYSGFGGPGTTEGWWDSLTSNSVAQNWGQYVGNRYRNNKNIIWVNGGDYLPNPGAEQTLSDNIRSGLIAGGANQIQTYHASRGNSAFSVWGTSTYALNDLYTDDVIDSVAATEYARGSFPLLQIEDLYENNTTSSGDIVEKWQALCSGCCGVLHGDELLWPFSTGYAAQFSSDGSVGAQRLASVATTYPLTTLVPKTDTSLVSSSLGSSGTSKICPALGTYSGGKFAIVAVPTATNVTLVMTNFTQGSVRVRWMDPKSGSLSTAAGSPFANTGSQTITHPGNNSMGTSIQVLIAD